MIEEDGVTKAETVDEVSATAASAMVDTNLMVVKVCGKDFLVCDVFVSRRRYYS